MPFGELCRVTTSDGLRLDGVYRPPDPVSLQPTADAVLLVHGTGSNFYSGGILERFAEQAVAAGMAALRINTRGHDLACSIPAARGSVPGGAAFEAIEDAPLDLRAWLALLIERGHRRIVLAGHSMGGVKAILSMAGDELTSCHHAVAAVVGISPPRFCHAKLAGHVTGEAFRRDYARASELVAANQGKTLIEVTQPLPLVITATGFCRKYGPGDPFDYTRVLGRIPCPVLVLVGSESMAQSGAFERLADTIAALESPGVTVQTIPGANIAYAKCLDEPFRRTLEWLRSAEPTAS